jgi:polyisoprenoid-binding protein YceI
MKNSLLSALAIALSLSGSVSAQTPAKAAVKIEPGAYAVDPYHTQVTFAVSHMGFTEFRGRLGNASGTLQLDAEHPADSSFEVTVPTDSVNTPVDKLTEELKGDQWLDAKANPQITFKAKSVTVAGPQTAKVTGDLTLHGVTKPLTLEHVSVEQIRKVPSRIKGFSGGHLRQSLSALILFWSPSNADFVFC